MEIAANYAYTLTANPLSRKCLVLPVMLAVGQEFWQQKSKTPRLRRGDRIFWVSLSKLWSGWRSALVIVQPDTVVGWHRQGFKLFWRWKSRTGKVGRPKIEADIRRLIERMSRENPLWGTPRIQSELALLGHIVAASTVDQYRIHPRKPPSPTWRAFLNNHVRDIVAIDFFTVPTATFRVLFTFVVLRHDRRQVAHFNVTAHPTAEWTAQQIVEAFPFDKVPRFLIRHRDGICGDVFQNRVQNMGIEEVLIAPRSPWQNPYCERLVGSIRRECLDHVIVINERHLRRILQSYFEYYLNSRTHLSLDRNSPIKREVEPPCPSRIVAVPQVGGLHHRYRRAA
jgi:transposase InsO family protein